MTRLVRLGFASGALRPISGACAQNGFAVAGATEIAARRSALSNSSDAQVKSFAQRLPADHTRLVDATRHGITAAPGADASVTGSLETLHGDAFDKPHIQQVALAGHGKPIAGLSTESMKGNGALLKNTAAGALPIINYHYIAS